MIEQLRLLVVLLMDKKLMERFGASKTEDRLSLGDSETFQAPQLTKISNKFNRSH